MLWQEFGSKSCQCLHSIMDPHATTSNHLSHSFSQQHICASMRARVPAWVEDLKTWAVFGVSGSFYIAVHLALEVPFTSEVWPWWVYFVIVLIQLTMSVFISRTMPSLTIHGVFPSPERIAPITTSALFNDFIKRFGWISDVLIFLLVC